MPPQQSRSRSAAIGIPLGCLLVLAIIVPEFGGSLIPTMGILVVAAALFLTLRQTAIVAGAAVLTAVGVALVTGTDHAPYRIGNVLLASALGVGVSWAIDRRVRQVTRMRNTQERVFQAVPDGLVVLDNEGLVVSANPAMVAFAPELQEQQPLHAALTHVLEDGSECSGGCLLDDPSRLAQGEPLELIEGERLLEADSLRWVDYAAARVDQDTVVVSLRDVTAFMEAEQDRRALLESAARQREQTVLLQALGSPLHTQLPAVPGLELDSWSTTAGPDSPTGGDIVDVSLCPDGRVLIIIIDALGSGVTSVRDAWKVLYVSRAHYAAGVPLNDLVSRVAQTLAAEAEPPRASLLAAVLDPAGGDLELVTGGHPPPLLVHEDGRSRWLEAGGRGVGAPQPGSRSVVGTRLLATDSLVIYTDGVVDGTRDLVEGLSNLKATASALRRRPTQGWTQAAMDALLQPAQARGDASMLLVRLARPPQQTES